LTVSTHFFFTGENSDGLKSVSIITLLIYYYCYYPYIYIITLWFYAAATFDLVIGEFWCQFVPDIKESAAGFPQFQSHLNIHL